MASLYEKTISNVVFSSLNFQDWASQFENVTEIMSSLFDLVRHNFSIILSLLKFLMIIFR